MKKSWEYFWIALIFIALSFFLYWFTVNLAKLMIESSVIKTEQTRPEMPAKSNAYEQDRNQESRPDSLDYFMPTSRNDRKRP